LYALVVDKKMKKYHSIMKKIITYAFLFFCTATVCFAQKSSKIAIKDIDVTSSEEIINALPRDAVYIFPEFTQGKVFFKDGIIDSAKFNYNSLVNEMQYLDKGDILTIRNPQNVAYVLIAQRVFYYVSEKSFAEILINRDNIKLLAKRQTKHDYKQEKTAAYGQASATTAVTNFSQMHYGGGQNKDLAIRRDMQFTIVDEYLLEINGKFTKISGKSSFIKAFPALKNEINEYVKLKKPNFKNEKDLINLTKYCINLSTVEK
jgi:hypothetical protein